MLGLEGGEALSTAPRADGPRMNLPMPLKRSNGGDDRDATAVDGVGRRDEASS